jgi:hypothetical protein
MAEELAARDRRGESVYHACAVYHDETSRKAFNAKAMNAFWLDIDCGDGKARKGAGYETKAEAQEALSQFCADCGLPEPMIVDSGGGLHVYWILDEEILASDWKPVAEKLKKLCSFSGFKADPNRTADAASILRPVGTHTPLLTKPKTSRPHVNQGAGSAAGSNGSSEINPGGVLRPPHQRRRP